MRRGRSTYQLADEATATFEDARDAVAAFVGARGSELVFTKNATEAINLVALAIGHASLGRPASRGGGAAAADDPARRLIIGEGDEVVVTRAEHHANLVPWQELCARTGATLRWLDLTEDGRIDTGTLDVITERTRVLALTHASNVTGAISPLDLIVPRAQQVGALVVLDTCQSAAHLPLDFRALKATGVDAMVLSSHKMLGPTGIGALVATEELLAAMPPVLTGGSMIEVVTMESSTFMSGPPRFEAGSQPLAQAAGMGAQRWSTWQESAWTGSTPPSQVLTRQVLEASPRSPDCGWSARPTPPTAWAWSPSPSRESTPTRRSGPRRRRRRRAHRSPLRPADPPALRHPRLLAPVLRGLLHARGSGPLPVRHR